MKKITLCLILVMMITSFTVFAAAQQEPVAEGELAPITIDWFVNEGWFNRPWDAENTLVDGIITEKTGISINFMNSAGGGTGTEKLNAMIAADNLTDVVTMGWWYTQYQELQSAGMLQPLDVLMDKYAPSFKELTPKSMINWYSYTDGHLYGFANMFWDEEQFTDENYMT